MITFSEIYAIFALITGYIFFPAIICDLIFKLYLAADEWSRSRAYIKCVRAIVNYEWEMGVPIAKSLRFGLKIMRKSEMP